MSDYEAPLSSSSDYAALEPPTAVAFRSPTQSPDQKEKKVTIQLHNCVSPASASSESSGPEEEVLVYRHEHVNAEDILDVKALLTDPSMLSAAQKLDINLQRVRKGRRCCALNLLLLALCLAFQLFAWYVYYHYRECDTVAGTVSYSLNEDLESLRRTIAAYGPSLIRDGSWLPSTITISDPTETRSIGSTISDEYRIVYVRTAGLSGGTPIEAANFTSYFVEANIPRPDSTNSSTYPIRFSFGFGGGANVQNFTRVLSIPLNVSDWSQPVIESAWCVFDSSATYSSCNSSTMANYCNMMYGTEALWTSSSSLSDDCSLNSQCGYCSYKRYLANYSVVVKPIASASDVYGPDNIFQSPYWPFNNANFPPFAQSPAQDASSHFFIPRLNDSDIPSFVTVRLYKSDDPSIQLQRLTQGTNSFSLFANGGGLFQQGNTSSTVHFEILEKVVMASCGIPYMFTAWAIFIVLFVTLIVICRSFPNFGLEADVDHDVETEYEDYDEKPIEEESETNSENGKTAEPVPQIPRADSASFSSSHRSQPSNEPLP